MSFTTIRAPISGRIGRSLVSPGDLVSSSTGDLTTLVSIDPIEALFQVSEATYISNLESRMDNERDLEAVRNIEVTLELINGVGYPEVGRIDYFANRIDTTTGTLEARASIPNPHQILVPGQYVRVTLQDTNLLEGLFVPQAAIQGVEEGEQVIVRGLQQVRPGMVVTTTSIAGAGAE